MNRVPMTLYAQFEQAPPESVLASIQDELVAIMSPAGLSIAWHGLSEAGNRVADRLVVVHFLGECDAEGLQSEFSSPGPLGWTHISDGEILPFIDIDCEGLRIFVQRDLLCLPNSDRETAFGRALGRVLAHELYHVLANTKTHARSGIAQSHYTVEELLAQSLRFGRKEYQALRDRSPRLGSSAGP